MGKNVSGYISGVTIILGLVFGVWKIEDRYATAADVGQKVYELQQSDVETKKKLEGLEVRIDIKTLEDYRDNLQERVWKLDDRYGIGCAECVEEVRDMYTKTVIDIEKIDTKLRELRDE